ncbi:putative transposase, partial [Pedobacter cryoconitis]
MKGLAEALVVNYKVSVHRACEVTKFCRSMWYYKKLGRDDQVIRMRMKEIAETRVRYGSERI